ADGLCYWLEKFYEDETVVNMRKIARGFVLSKEFIEKDFSDETFIQKMYLGTFGREYDEAGLQYWLEKMEEGMTREQVFYGFANSVEFKKMVLKYISK
ncbi:MAG: DUF4214 domain-containing protein, partial [Lachnospiraceae bacterium]|nr:DUF4214 domain-containing protein [Lachnospiraceae bacterium]